MTENKSFYVTTPIYYVNAEPHIGHIYSTLLADVLARYARQKGEKVFFLTGTDEHGQKIQEKAEEEEIQPIELADRVAKQFQQAFDLFKFSYNYFIRTTSELHVENVKHIWNLLYGKDLIYKGFHKGWYSISDETFYPPNEVVEKDGQHYSKATSKPLVWHEEENYLFRLSQFEDRLIEFYEKNPNWITPSFRQHEIVEFVKGGLRDLSVSRRRETCQWGIEVPNDSGHTIYVWLDALSNYLSATLHSFSPEEREKDIVNNNWWPCNVHVIGKDILKFHAIYWPAFLLALDLPITQRLVVHGWWTLNGEKISKSLGNVFDPWEKAKQYGSDNLRYYLLRDTSFSHDGDFSDERMVGRINGELANSLGNLVTRALSKSLLTFTQIQINLSEITLTEVEEELVKKADKTREEVDHSLLVEINPQRALESIWHFIDLVNSYINLTAPWKARKENKSRYEVIMTVLLESIRFIGELLSSFMPETADKILLHFPKVESPLNWGGLKAGQTITQPEGSLLLFNKIN